MSTTTLPGARTEPELLIREESRNQLLTRVQIDRSCRRTVVMYYGSAVFWLIIGSIFAMITSIKMHNPGFLGSWQWLTFGRVRPVHLNLVSYGWASMAAVGTLLWLQARLFRVRLPYRTLLPVTCIVWNITVTAGAIAILAGYGSSIEWLEYPPQALAAFAFIFLILLATSFKMFRDRQVEHTYVSSWYLFAAVIWFPILYSIAVLTMQFDSITGAAKATVNWWFGHNTLGLWVTPVAIATSYFMIPKVTGKPIHSYHISLLGFWSLALFYNWAGTHHLVGGPLPAWIITVGIVGSMMMLIPVTTLAINHHLTMVGSFHLLKTSPTLRFVVFGSVVYTVVSAQGSFEALRPVSRVAHFTHYTVAHAHLGLYGFFSMIMFGAYYYILPRLTRNEWASAWMIKLHFWTAALGIIAYFVALSWGGWFQGEMMNDPSVPFLKTVEYTKPYLVARSISGAFMTIANFTFAVLVWRILYRRNDAYGPTLFQPSATESAAEVTR